MGTDRGGGQLRLVKKIEGGDGRRPDLIFHYLLNIIVFQFRVCSLEYFLDDCTIWEINDIIENLPYLDRSLWETARMNAYVVAQVNSKKKLTQQDILQFKWEDMDDLMSEEDTKITPYDKERLKKLADDLSKANWVEIEELKKVCQKPE